MTLITSSIKLSNNFAGIRNSWNERGIVFFVGLWGLYYFLAYCMLVQFSLVRDNLGLLTPIVFYAAVGVLAWKAVAVVIKYNKTSLPKSIAYILTALAMVYFAHSSLQFFSNCFRCSGPTATFRIILSKGCSSLINTAQSNAQCKLYSNSYSDGDYSIIVFDSNKDDAVSVVGTVVKSDAKERDFYVLFGRYIVLYQWIPYYLGPMGSPYF